MGDGDHNENGDYVGPLAEARCITIPVKLDAILILHQSVRVDEDSEGGFVLKGSWATKDEFARIGDVNMLAMFPGYDSQGNERTSLYVRNYTFFTDSDAGIGYNVCLNKKGETYHYIGFVSEEGTA